MCSPNRVQLIALIWGLLPGYAGAQRPPTFIATRDLHIGAVTADISRAGSLLVARNGDILVIDDQDNIFRRFGVSGSLGQIGREGEGPGEFRNIRSAGWFGDSLWVHDPSLKRITIFGPNYVLVRSFAEPTTVRLPEASQDSTPVQLYVQAVLPGGDLRAMATFRPRHKPSWATDVDSGYSVLLRTSRTGVLRNRIGVVPPNRCAFSKSAGRGGTWTAYIPFCNSWVATDWDQAPTALIASVEQGPGRIPSTTYRLTLVNERGLVLLDRSYSFVPVPVAQAALDSMVAFQETRNARLGPEYTAFAKSLRPEANFPAVRRVQVGRDSTVWLEESAAGRGHHWRVLDARGTVLGMLTLPDNVSLQAADLHTVWGYESDADGLQGIVRYRLERRGSQ